MDKSRFLESIEVMIETRLDYLENIKMSSLDMLSNVIGGDETAVEHFKLVNKEISNLKAIIKLMNN